MYLGSIYHLFIYLLSFCSYAISRFYNKGLKGHIGRLVVMKTVKWVHFKWIFRKSVLDFADFGLFCFN